MQKEYGTAKDYYRKCLALLREIGDNQAIVTGLVNLPLLAAREGQTLTAEEYLVEGVQPGRELQNKLMQGVILAVTVVWSAQPNKIAPSGQLIKLVETLLTASGGVLEQVYLQPYLEVKAQLQPKPDPVQLDKPETAEPDLGSRVATAFEMITHELPPNNQGG